jgi:hypothetical protein
MQALSGVLACRGEQAWVLHHEGGTRELFIASNPCVVLQAKETNPRVQAGGKMLGEVLAPDG